LQGLAASRQVIAWDCPGYGDSADFPDGHPTCHDFAKSLLAALDAAGIGDFDLVGHSMGGAVAPWVARLAPLRVGKLVLSATKVAFGKDNPLGYHKRLAERRQMDDATFGKARAKDMVGEDSHVFAEVAVISSEIRLSGYEGAVSLLKTADNSAILPTVDQPTLVIAGENDGIAPADATQAVADTVPNARLEIIRDSAHAAYMQQPKAYNALLNEFLAN
jgi:pimeloyl-ACP methyl ester carboxylesterase